MKTNAVGTVLMPKPRPPTQEPVYSRQPGRRRETSEQLMTA